MLHCSKFKQKYKELSIYNLNKLRFFKQLTANNKINYFNICLFNLTIKILIIQKN